MVSTTDFENKIFYYINRMFKIVDTYDIFAFDLDDTLIKTEVYHYEAWLQTIRELIGCNFFISYDIFCSKFHSTDSNSIYNYIINELKLSNFNNICAKKQIIYFDLLHKNIDNIQLIDGVELLINKIMSENKQFVIVTNAKLQNLNFFIELFPILKMSSKNYTSDVFINKKPNSECYLNVIKDYPNKRIVGFEDSITGIHALIGSNSIKAIFINDANYYYYDYILRNYRIEKTIRNYLELTRIVYFNK